MKRQNQQQTDVLNALGDGTAHTVEELLERIRVLRDARFKVAKNGDPDIRMRLGRTPSAQLFDKPTIPVLRRALTLLERAGAITKNIREERKGDEKAGLEEWKITQDGRVLFSKRPLGDEVEAVLNRPARAFSA